ncbi:AAA family ATPase [Reyranella soli]|uniref:AAA family ATPase n=1 Tax=Reyranella soli TaxID=1230389 RepID=UPI0014786688|nr:AAA family ATPase [Reyranella soli]
MAHFRPKSVVVEDKSSQGYWWLAYDWDNLFVLCPRCNQMKGARFPIPINAKRALSPGDNLSNERPLLLNPCVEDPNAHLAFDDSGLVVGQTERGRITIEIYGLNREELVSARQLAIANKLDLWRVSLNEIRRSDQTAVDRLAVGEDVEYAAALRAASHRFVLENERALMHSAVGRRFIGRARKARPIGHEQIERLASAAKRKEVAYSVESAADTDSAAFLAARRRIERIEIRDFKSIKQLSIRFPVPQSEDEAWLMLLGENATGKSSVLQAVALALMGSAHANALGLDAKSFLRHNADSREGSVEVHLTNLNDPVRMTFGKDVDGFQVTPAEPKVLLLGYGATRLLPRPGLGASDENKYIRIKNLFDPTAPLNDAEAWLSDKTKVSQDKFEEVAEALREALLLPPTVKADRERGHVEFVHPDDRLRLSDLSDGYQSVIAMVADIAFCVFEKWGSIEEAEAIVLLDEIEVHLHPRWKMTIVERLRRCFPRLSFITTTHDPLCLRGLHSNEVMVLRRAADGAIDTLTDIPDLDSYRADQLLTSPLFDLVTTRGPRTEEDRARYGVLLEKKRRSPAEEAEYLELEAKLGALSIDETVRPDTAAARIDDVNLDAAVQQITAGLSEEIRRQIAKVIVPAGEAE